MFIRKKNFVQECFQMVVFLHFYINFATLVFAYGKIGKHQDIIAAAQLR